MLCHEDEVKLLRYVLVRIKNKTTLQHSGSERHMFHKKRSQCGGTSGAHTRLTKDGGSD